MLEKILPYEEGLFFLINGSHSYFWDCVMWLFSDGFIWSVPAAFLIFSLVYKKKWQVWLPVFICIIILFVCCDQFSSTICKPYFERLRPTHYPDIEEYVRTLHGYFGGKYGFISGHATNSFGFAIFTTFLFRNKYYTTLIYIWAFILSYSRIYLGVHFVSDVVAGAMAGSIIGFLIYKLYDSYLNNHRWFHHDEKEILSVHRLKLVTLAMLSYMLIIILLGEQIIYFF